jgi:hypothetical protein
MLEMEHGWMVFVNGIGKCSMLLLLLTTTRLRVEMASHVPVTAASAHNIQRQLCRLSATADNT